MESKPSKSHLMKRSSLNRTLARYGVSNLNTLKKALEDSRQETSPKKHFEDMVERFNGRISDILKSTHFPSSKALAETISHYLKIYNYHIPQKNIGHQTPAQKLLIVAKVFAVESILCN